MGSEHYCLRWNNYQSNLLGVFSQLLQDESLVDVTLACSEGAPIKAHKVVLSACSSYFQSIFQDHPERHPIVILKDVRFAELQTLVEFMYKGEVNVQYCQLSALLKTAESLKVKGLAEMTNQNTTLREPEREPDRLRPHSQPSKSTCDSPVDAALAGPSTSTATNACLTSATHTATTNSANTNSATLANAIHSSAHKREAIERCSPSPPKRLQTATTTTTSAATAALEHDRQPQPLDLYQGRIETIEESSGSISVISGERARANETNNVSNSCTGSSNNNNNNQQHRSNTPHGSGTSNTYNNGDEREFLSSPTRSATCSLQDEADIGVPLTKIEDVDDYDEDMDLEEDADNSSNEVGLNMKIGSCHTSAAAVVPSPLGGIGNAGVAEPESARSTPAATMNTANLPSDLTQRPASRSSRDGAVSVSSSAHTSTLERPSSSGMCGLPTATAISIAGGLSPSAASTSGLGSETLPGTSGLGPVQSVPLSLKKEIDISEDDNSNSRHPRSASAGGGLGGGELDYRASHESETSESPHGAGGSGVGIGVIGGNSTSGGGGGSGPSSAHEPPQPQTPPPMFPCVYCGAAFPHQSKLTRHILSHSLKTLEYREPATHTFLNTHLLSHELNMPPLQQQFAYQINAAAAMASSSDPQEQAAVLAAATAAIEMDFAAAVVAAGGCAALSGISGCGTRGGLDLDGSAGVTGGGSSRAGSTGGGGGSSSGSGGGGGGGIGSSASGNGSSCSGLLLSGAGSSSTSAAAVAAAAAASKSSSLLGASSDPNSVVLCKFCGKSFPDVASLITHLTIHTGERPFKCEFCGKAFKLRHHMKDHCRVHTGERPFRCHMCGKTFSRSTILKAHEKTHFPKYVRKFLSPSPVDTNDELPQ